MTSRDPRWDTIAGRIDWVLENRPEWKGSRRKWSMAAGCSHGTVHGIHARNGGMNSTTAGALARAANVDVDWFVTGVGFPERAEVQLVDFPGGKDPLPKRRIAANRMRNSGVPDEFLERIARSPRYNTVEAQFRTSKQWVDIFVQEIMSDRAATMGTLKNVRRKPQRRPPRRLRPSAPRYSVTARTADL